jgi:hypothetical protein
MNIEINKRYYNTTTRGADGIDRVNVNAIKYYYEVKFNSLYFEYDNLEELKANIENDILELQNRVEKELIKKRK